jgi:hypothetical protein
METNNNWTPFGLMKQQGQMFMYGCSILGELTWAAWNWIKAKWKGEVPCAACGHHEFWHEVSDGGYFRTCKHVNCDCFSLLKGKVLDKSEVDPTVFTSQPGRTYANPSMPSVEELRGMIARQLSEEEMYDPQLLDALTHHVAHEGYANLTAGKEVSLTEGGDRAAMLTYNPEIASKWDEAEEKMEEWEAEREHRRKILRDAGYLPQLHLGMDTKWEVIFSGSREANVPIVLYCKYIPTPTQIKERIKMSL